MDRSGEVIRCSPVSKLPEDEEHKHFEDLCNAMMAYAHSIGIRLDMFTVEHKKGTYNTKLTEEALAKLRISLYRTIAAHGCAENSDELAGLLLNPPKIASD